MRASGLHAFDEYPSLDIQKGNPIVYEGYRVIPFSFLIWRDFRAHAALWLPNSSGPQGCYKGVVVLPGHFGEGKSSGECQEMAHALAARGIAALAVDPPGIEEGDRPERQIHFDEGAHNRAVLASAGTSALGLQLHVARRGLDAFHQLVDLTAVAVTGASGGSVLSFYLLLARPELAGGAMVSFVPLPREGRAGGCPCDTLPGWPGPDPSVLAALDKPSIWVSETRQPPPSGLPDSASFVVVEGPHGYTAKQRAVVLPWLDHLLDNSPPDARRSAEVALEPPYTPPDLLQTPTGDHLGIFPLALQVGHPGNYEPRPQQGVPYVLECKGTGPVVVSYGAQPADEQALLAAGLSVCVLDVPADLVGLAEAIAENGAYADRFAGAVASACSRKGALGAYGVGAYGVAVAASGVPFVVRDPVMELDQVDTGRDPPWVHVPGAWWGTMDKLYGQALALGSKPDELAHALVRLQTQQHR